MKNIFINIGYNKVSNMKCKARENYFKRLAKKHSITITLVRYMYQDISRINTCQNKILKYSSKIW